MSRCASTKRHFANSVDARQRLEEIQRAPLEPGRFYSPTAVIRCHCGGFVLTSDHNKRNARGKTRRSRRTR